jgi:hypothetical protein
VYGKQKQEEEPTDDNFDDEADKIKKTLPKYRLKVIPKSE